MAYNAQTGSQHSGDIQYEGDPNDVQIDFENDQIILKTGGAPRVSVVNTQLSSSGIFLNVGSITGSEDLAVSGNVHSSNVYGAVLSASSDVLIRRNLLTANSNFAVFSDGSIVTAGLISGSSTLTSVGSISSSGDLAVTGAVHATTFYGSAAGLTGIPGATSLSGTTAELTVGVETSGYLKVTGSTTLTGPLSASGNAPFRIQPSISASGDLALTGTVHAQNAYLSLTLSGAVVRGSRAQFVGSDIEFDRASAAGMFAPVGQPFISNKGYYSGSAVFHNDGAISSSADIAVSGAVHATTFYGSAAGLTGIPGATSLSGTTAELTVGVETSGYLRVSGSSTLGGPAGAGTTITGTGSFSTIVATGSISGSSILTSVGSISSSGDLAVSGAVHATTFYGSAAGLTGIPGATSLSGTTAELTVGVETSGYLRVSGSSTLGGPFGTGTTITGTGSFSTIVATGSISGSSILTSVGSISSSGDLAVSGAVHATTFYGSAAGLTGIPGATSLSGTTAELTVGVETSGYLRVSGSSTLGGPFGTGTTITGTGSFSTIVATGSISGSSILTSVGSISSSGDLAVSGAVHATTFYGSAAGLTGIPGATSLSGTTAELTVGVETSGYLRVSGSSTLGGPFGTGTTITGTGSFSTIVATGSISGSSTLLAQGNTVLGGTAAISGNVNVGGPNLANSRLYVKGDDAAVVAIFKSDSHDTIMALTGSGEVAIGGLYLDALLNVSGADNRKLIAAAGNSRGDTFYVSASGETFISGNLHLQDTEPTVYFSSSNGAQLGQIGFNSSTNLLIQNDTQNRHIVFKANDNGTVKEGLRLDGAVPEVVVNQGGTDFNNTLVDFRVESDNNEHMLYVKGLNDAVGVNNSDPKTVLDVHHDPTSLANDTGGGEAVKFGTGTTVAGKLYYLHSGSSWQQTDMITAASGGLGMLGIALGTAPATDGMLIRGFFDAHTYLSGNFTAGTTLYISAPGYITTMRPSGSNEVLRVLGNCTTTSNVIYFNPSPDYLVIS